MRVASLLGSIVLAAGFMLPLAASAAGKCERLIATGAVDNPPFLWRDPEQPERLVGASADLARQIAESIGVKLELLPFGTAAQARAEVVAGRADLLLDAALLSEHLNTMDFVHPPIASLQVLPWVRDEQSIAYSSREDLAGQPGMRLEGVSLGDQFDAFAKANLNLATTADLSEGLQALADGRVAYLLHERYATIAGAASMGLVDSLQVLEPPVLSKGMHLAVSHNSACNDPWLRGQLALRMTELSAAGIPRKLIAENLERWLEQQRQLTPEAPIQD